LQVDSGRVLPHGSLRTLPRREWRAAPFYLPVRAFMNRIILTALLLSALTGCVNDPNAPHHGTPPKDPQDYHGVPTDDRPPSMLNTPEAPK